MLSSRKTERIILLFLAACLAVVLLVSYAGTSAGRRVDVSDAELSPEEQNAEEIISASKRIDINSAGAREFEHLPGIGTKLAGAVIEYRRENGAFALPEDIMKVPGIGPSKYDKMRRFIHMEKTDEKSD